MKHIAEIKAELDSYAGRNPEEFIAYYSSDERSGVKKLVEAAKKNWKAYEEELIRLENMRKFEKELSHVDYICGVDEVGRGPLAGPVVAAAVILPKDLVIPYVNDSKKLSEAKREKLFHEITREALSIGFGCVDNLIIDEVNILNATFMAMKKAIESLSICPDVVLVDGNREIPGLSLPQRAIVKGDQSSISIASASIVAKVSRDKQMEEYHKLYPMYDLANNKGYGSKRHYEGIVNFGLSPIHRKSFIHE